MIAGFRKIHSGLEHEVFFRKAKEKQARVIKITKPPHFGHTWDLENYLQNLIWSNQLFEDDVEIEGVIETEDGVSVVTSQSYIHGRQPTEEQVAAWFQSLGAIPIGTNKWKLPNGLIISDAHTGNLILQSDGTMIPIDLHVELPCPLPELAEDFEFRLLPVASKG